MNLRREDAQVSEAIWKASLPMFSRSQMMARATERDVMSVNRKRSEWPDRIRQAEASR